MGLSMKLGLALTALTGLLAVSGCKPPPAAKPAEPASAPAAAPPAPAASAPASAPATGPDALAAGAFLERLYGHYRNGTDNTFEMFDKDAKAVFDADTLRLLAADTKALKGELGEIDGDWLCNCQDFTSLQATITVTSATPTAAQATADFHDTGDPARKPDHDSFDLVKTNGAWRIHDITIRGQPLSLRATLQKELSDLAHGAPAVSGPSDAR